MRFRPDRQQDLFKPPSMSEALPVGIQARLRPLLSMLLSEAARGEVTTETTGRIGDDQDHA